MTALVTEVEERTEDHRIAVNYTQDARSLPRINQNRQTLLRAAWAYEIQCLAKLVEARGRLIKSRLGR